MFLLLLSELEKGSLYGCASRKIGLNSENLGGALIVTACVRKCWRRILEGNKSAPLSPVTFKAAPSFSDSW